MRGSSVKRVRNMKLNQVWNWSFDAYPALRHARIGPPIHRLERFMRKSTRTSRGKCSYRDKKSSEKVAAHLSQILICSQYICSRRTKKDKARRIVSSELQWTIKRHTMHMSSSSSMISCRPVWTLLFTMYFAVLMSTLETRLAKEGRPSAPGAGWITSAPAVRINMVYKLAERWIRTHYDCGVVRIVDAEIVENRINTAKFGVDSDPSLNWDLIT